MHSIFGTNSLNKRRAISNKTAHDKGFGSVHMNKLLKEMWITTFHQDCTFESAIPSFKSYEEKLKHQRSWIRTYASRSCNSGCQGYRTFLLLTALVLDFIIILESKSTLQTEENPTVDHLTPWRYLYFRLENRRMWDDIYWKKTSRKGVAIARFSY